MRFSSATLLFAYFILADARNFLAKEVTKLVVVTTTITIAPATPMAGVLPRTVFLPSLPRAPRIIISAASRTKSVATLLPTYSSQYITFSVSTAKNVSVSQMQASQVKALALEAPSSNTRPVEVVTITVDHYVPPSGMSSLSTKPAATRTVTSVLWVVPFPYTTMLSPPRLIGKIEDPMPTNFNETFRQFDDNPVRHGDGNGDRKDLDSWWMPVLVVLGLLFAFSFVIVIYCCYGRNRNILGAQQEHAPVEPNCAMAQWSTRRWMSRPKGLHRLDMSLPENWSFNRDLEGQNDPTHNSTRNAWARHSAIELVLTPIALSAIPTTPLSVATTVVECSPYCPPNLTLVRRRASSDPLGTSLPSYEASTLNSLVGRHVAPMPMAGAYPSTLNSSTSDSPKSEELYSPSSSPDSTSGLKNNNVIPSARSARSLRRAQQLAHMQEGLRNVGAF